MWRRFKLYDWGSDWDEVAHESLLGIIGEVIMVLNAALEPSKIFALSTYYAQELHKLRRVLLCTQDVLNYIQEALVDEKKLYRIGSWLKEVEKLANDVHSKVKELMSQVDGGGAQIDEKDHINKVSNSFPAPPPPLHSNNIPILQKTRKKLIDLLYGKTVSKWLWFVDWKLLERARESSSYLHNQSNKCVGRDGDVDAVIHNMLLKSKDHHNEGVVEGLMEAVDPIVVSILGFHGIGKTALAHLIFDDERVMRHFNCRVWVGRLEDDFDVSRITESIFRSTTSTTAAIGSASSDLDSSLPDHLQQALGGKRLLVVLDDVRGKVSDKWSELKALFLTSGFPRGSCILVTTRSEEVARVVGTSHFHYLKPLPEDVCWSLFAERAFWGATKDKCSELIEYSSTVMKRGGGVPLFVNVLGCHWRSVKFRQMWLKAQKNTLDIMPRIYYSEINYDLYSIYVSLPFELKRCFMICSLFPKNSWIEKGTVIQIWMALDSYWQHEAMCSQYFDDLLLMNSFFKDLERDDVDGSFIRCRMHPPAHDFAYYRMSNDLSIKTASHLSLVCTKGTKSIHDILDTDRTLQSLLIFGNPTNLELSYDIFDRFRFLKILDLGGSGITHLPDSLCKLKDLRHLNLSSTKISKLPKTISDLRFLEILKLSYSKLSKLPKETGLLTRLRHLEIEGTCINFLPKGIGRLTNLQKLSEFIIGVHREACSIRELGNLDQLQGKLVISNLNKLASRDEAKNAKLKQKDLLDCLVLNGQEHFNYQSMDPIKHFDSLAFKHLYKRAMESNKSKEYVEMEMVFEGLEPHENLKRLEIWNYNGRKFPSWMAKQSPNIVSLRLAKCGMLELLPPLGSLPFLKYLHIQGMDKIKYLGRELNGEGNITGFSKLECLIFEEMSSWEKWDLKVEKGEMPCLKKLILCHCSVLSVMPSLPRALTELTLQDCPKLQKISSLPEFLKIFTLHHCDTLEALPNLPMSVRKLVIVDCTSLTALPQLPIALWELTLRNCPRMKEPVQDLPNTLRELEFSNWSTFAAPQQLPATLKVLSISNYSESTWNSDTSLPHLEHIVLACKDRLFKSLPKLPNLVSLKIMMSSELASLPSELSQLKTLKTLNIHFCPKLRSLPEELQQLTNLQNLIIVGCGHLKERYQMEKGPDWYKIAHVRYIKIDDKIQPNWMRIHDSF